MTTITLDSLFAATILNLFLLVSFLGISIFKKHWIMNVAVFFFCISFMYLYHISEYDGMAWVTFALVSLAGYQLYAMSKSKG